MDGWFKTFPIMVLLRAPWWSSSCTVIVVLADRVISHLTVRITTGCEPIRNKTTHTHTQSVSLNHNGTTVSPDTNAIGVCVCSSSAGPFLRQTLGLLSSPHAPSPPPIWSARSSIQLSHCHLNTTRQSARGQMSHHITMHITGRMCGRISMLLSTLALTAYVFFCGGTHDRTRSTKPITEFTVALAACQLKWIQFPRNTQIKILQKCKPI